LASCFMVVAIDATINNKLDLLDPRRKIK